MPKVTIFGSQTFGYQIWFCTRLLNNYTLNTCGKWTPLSTPSGNILLTLLTSVNKSVAELKDVDKGGIF